MQTICNGRSRKRYRRRGENGQRGEETSNLQREGYKRMVKPYWWRRSMVDKPLSKLFLSLSCWVFEILWRSFGSLSSFCSGSDPTSSIFSAEFFWSSLIQEAEFLQELFSANSRSLSNFGLKEMAQRPNVPKFGNWESEENVPYTAYFDKARKGRTGTMINPNDPQKNSDLVDNSSLAHQPASKPKVDSEDLAEKGSVKSTHELQKGKNDSDPKQFSDSPHQHGGHGVGSADTRRRPSRQSPAGSEYSIERSPLHRQAWPPGRDSPSWERKNSYDSSHGTPGRSRPRHVNRGDEILDEGAAVPKFGEWDESNPASADGYSHIFSKVREERQGGSGHALVTPTARSPYVRNQANNDKAQSCCFWFCRE